MANLSNINGKFVVEQTTGYVGVGTTDPNFLIEAAGTNSEIALNSTSGSIYRVRSTSSDAFIITKNGVGDRLVIDGAGNSTFAGTVTATEDSQAQGIFQGWSTTGANGASGAIRLGGNSAYQGRIDYAADDNTEFMFDNTYASGIYTFSIAGSEKIRIDSSGTVIVKNPTTSNLQLQSDQTTWNENDVISNLNTFVSDTSAAGARDVAAIKVINEQGGTNTTMSGAMAFYTSAYNATVTERMRIASNGNVGINGASNFGLDNKAIQLINGVYSGAFQIDSVGNVGLAQNAYQDGTWKYYQTNEAAILNLEDGQFKFFNAASGTAGTAITFSERMRIDSSGTVSITSGQRPTTGKGGALIVGGDADGTGLTTNTRKLGLITCPSYNNSNGNMSMVVGDTSSSTVAKLVFGSSNTGYASPTQISFHTTSTVGAIGTERMRIDGDGNVGIGETNPENDNRLHIKYSDANVTPLSSSPLVVERNDVCLIQTLTSNASDAGILFGDGDDNDIGGLFYLHGSDAMTFRTNTSERMRIDSSGNLSLGTVTPFYATGEGDLAQISVNRVPSNGVITNTSRSAAYVNINGSDGGSSFTFHTANANNTQPTERMQIKSNGQVNISQKPNSGLTYDVLINLGTSPDGIIGYQTQSQLAANLAVNSSSNWVKSGNDIYNTNSANVGIGDTSPQGKLEVNNRNTATGAALFIKGGEDDLDPVAGQYTGLAFGYGGGDIYNNAAILWEFTNTAANGKLHFAVNPTAGDGTANLSDSKMTILDSGNVAIGRTDARVRLEIEGAGQATANISDSGSGGAFIQASDTGNGVNRGGGILFSATNDLGTRTPQAAIKSLLKNGNSQGVGDLAFSTRANTTDTALTERMRITSGGEVLIRRVSSASTSFSLQVGDGVSDSYRPIRCEVASTSTRTQIAFHNPGQTAAVGAIQTYGTSTVYTTGSDYRLKENVVEMTGALDRVNQLRPSRFNFISDTDLIVDGFLAHEVQEIVPEAITGEKDAVDEDGNPIYQGIDQSKLVPLLVGAIKELKAEIELLKTQINN